MPSVSEIYGSAVNDNTMRVQTYISRATNDRELYLNGVSQGTDTTTLSSTSFNAYYLGIIRQGGTTFYSNGKVKVLLIRPVADSDEDRETIENILMEM